MARRGEVLVAIMNNVLDMRAARDERWYRIPVSSAEKWLARRWPPHWLAFYQTKVFGAEAYAVHYYARVLDIQQKRRWQLFPDQPRDQHSERRYWKLTLGEIRRLPQPILSPRWRRIVFIPTTWTKFVNATEINDLYDESPLEDRLWAALKRRQITAVRQELVPVVERRYFLDFAVYCVDGKIDLETDGDTWHSDPERIPLDNLRDNDLETVGWRVLRFSTAQIQEQMDQYCLPTVIENINRLKGLDEGRTIPRRVDPDGPGGVQQLSLFDHLQLSVIQEARMVTIRCTRKLQKLLGVPYTANPPPPENVLGDWYANSIWTAAGDLIIFCSEKTFLSVAVPVSAMNQFAPLFVARVANLLRELDVPETAVVRELAHYREVAIAKTASRSVLGVLNQLRWHYEWAAEQEGGEEGPSLARAELQASDLPHIGPDYMIPALVARELLGCSNEGWEPPSRW